MARLIVWSVAGLIIALGPLMLARPATIEPRLIGYNCAGALLPLLAIEESDLPTCNTITLI